MKPHEPSAGGVPSPEVASLITTLHETEARLAVLTNGEVDSISDREGHTFLMRNAQEQLRDIEAARQTGILDAVPAHIALLDRDGLITSVNEAWRRFARDNGRRDVEACVGLSYFEICDRVHGEDACKASAAAAGIRSVLSGAATSFSMDYPCHSPTEKRWFLLIVTPLLDGLANGAVVMHVNVTAKKRAEEDLISSEMRFGEIANNIHEVFFLKDAKDQRTLYVSPAYESIWGRSCESLYLDPVSWIQAIHPEDRASTYEAYEKGLAAGNYELKFRIVHADGGIRLILVKVVPVRDTAGKILRFAGVATDITEHAIAERKISHLNRVYAVLRNINSLVIRENDGPTLFREVCRIAVEIGGFRSVWIGTIDPETQDGRVVASFGTEPLHADHNFTLRDNMPGSTRPSSRALRQSKPVICNNIMTDPSVASVRDELLRNGFKAFACLPLIVSDQPIAVLVLYSNDPDIFNEEEVALLVTLAADIAYAIDHINKRHQLTYLAEYDTLTGLANRNLFVERLAQHQRTATNDGHKLALLMIDLERFRNINDSLGWHRGDELLKDVAEWLTRRAVDATMLARITSDQFAMVLPKIEKAADVSQFLEATLEAFRSQPFRLKEAEFRLAMKVGVTIFPDDGTVAVALLRNAEAALKQAKASGDRYLFYASRMTESAAENLSMESQLRQALEQNEFVLHFQPKVNLRSGQVTGAEALIRWNDPRTGMVPPGRFISILEQTGMIHDVGRWAMRKAIETHLRWRTAGLAALPIAVNVSALQLRSAGFIAEIEHAISQDPHAAAGLELEITESLVMENIKHNISSLNAIRAMGITIAIDDFGTGFSSLSYLAKLPVHTLKIDRSFVVDMAAGPDGLALVSTIINLAHSMRLKVVAEGVETEEQSRLLRLLTCDEMQGYLFSKPVPSDVFEAKFLVPVPTL